MQHERNAAIPESERTIKMRDGGTINIRGRFSARPYAIITINSPCVTAQFTCDPTQCASIADAFRIVADFIGR